MAAEEVPYKVRQANAARYRAHSTLESTEKEIRDWMRDDHGPRSIVTEQSLHPVITVKMKPNHAERSGSTAPPSIRGCGRGGSCLRNGHLSPLRVLLRQMRDQRDSLAKATAVLNAAVRTSGGRLWETPLELTRKDLADWLGEQVARVGKLKETIERK